MKTDCLCLYVVVRSVMQTALCLLTDTFHIGEGTDPVCTLAVKALYLAKN